MTRSGTVQGQAAVTVGLLAAAGLAWWSTAVRMEGMDAPPGTHLGEVGWFTVTWAVMMAAMMLPSLARGSRGGRLSWASGGRWLSVGVLTLASAYELTAIKRAFLTRCRCPLARASSRGRHDAIVEGIAAGVWCLGSSWALMAALFALGVMSLTWMALIAALVAFEKVVPWPRVGTVLAATVLAAIAFGVAAFPRNVPGLVVPASHAPMATMSMTAGQR
jgi:predicted metal-binding membrane protein